MSQSCLNRNFINGVPRVHGVMKEIMSTHPLIHSSTHPLIHSSTVDEAYPVNHLMHI
ncbi:MAG: hypothetical protein HC769_06610 [Cyanobacteria bacterium CRU_2_1]|nr:hypothetical protein [Cyanobacteria bacterium CRU_2_1]